MSDASLGFRRESEPFKNIPLGVSRPLPGEEGRGRATWLHPPRPAPGAPPRPPHSAGGAFDVPTRQLPKRLSPAPAPSAQRPQPAQAESARAPPAALRARRSGLRVRRSGAGFAPRTSAPHAPRAERTMPQLDSGGGGAGGGDDLGAPDELLAFQDEGEEQDKSRDSAAGPERDLAELKSSLVNESEGAAGGAGVPGTGAGGEAEVGAEVSAGPRPAPPRAAAAGLGLSRTRPSLPWPRGSPSLRAPPAPGPEPPAFPAPLTAPPISPQALGREHTSQRLFPDKLPEALEDGEFLHGPAARHPLRPRPPWEGRSEPRGRLPPTAAPGGGKTEGVGRVGGGFPGRLRARVTSGALTFIGVNRPPSSPPPLCPGDCLIPVPRRKRWPGFRGRLGGWGSGGGRLGKAWT